MFLSDEVDSLLTGEEMLAEKERLKGLLVDQAKLLDYGLYVHSEHLNEASKLLHNTLLDSFNEYRQKIQQLCGVDHIASVSRKASIHVSELDGQRRHTRYLSRLSTDSSLFNADSKPALQQRSMSITCPSDNHLLQAKKKLTKADALPLPPRRSNRHSSKLLKS
jgi:predicted secreted protein